MILNGNVLEDNPLYAAQMENRLLKEAITALRDKLEQERVAQTQAIQQAVGTANSEIQQLRATVQALRERMEGMVIAHENDTQKTLAETNDELGHLHGMIVALREELERHAQNA